MRNNRQATRREFLQNSMAALTAAGAVSIAAGYDNQVQAETKMCDRSTKPNWAISCRDAHLKETGEPDSWSAMKIIGADGAEVGVQLDLACPHLYAPGKTFSRADSKQIREIGRRFEARGQTITAFCLGNRFDSQREQEIDCTLKVAEAAHQLGVPAVRLDIKPRSWKGTDEGFLKLAIDVGRELVKKSAHTKVRFGVENHGHKTNNVEFMRAMLKGVGSDRFGVTLDTANFYWFGYPLTRLYDIYTEFAPHAVHTHAKSIAYPASEREKQRQTGWEYGKYCCPVYEGDIDFKRVAGILRKAGFAGDLCIENESLKRFPEPQRREVLKKEIAHLRAAAAATCA